MNRSYTEEIKQANEDYIVKKYSRYYYKYFKRYKSLSEELQKTKEKKKDSFRLFFSTFLKFRG